MNSINNKKKMQKLQQDSQEPLESEGQRLGFFFWFFPSSILVLNWC